MGAGRRRARKVAAGRPEGPGERLLGALLDRAHQMPPQLIAPLVAEEAARIGGRDVSILLQDYGQRMLRPLPGRGTYVAPAIVELDRARDLKDEVFGPVLHVVRWRAAELDALLDDIAGNGTALTLGIHSRIESTVARIAARLPHGNVYVNRNMIGAVVGSQPFGGSGLSGTGPKAGGPDYLHRLSLEQVVTVNAAAAGGNAALLSEEE